MIRLRAPADVGSLFRLHGTLPSMKAANINREENRGFVNRIARVMVGNGKTSSVISC